MNKQVETIIGELNKKFNKQFELKREFSTDGKFYFEEPEGLSVIITDNNKNPIDAITLVQSIKHLNGEVLSLVEEGIEEALFKTNKLVYSRYLLILNSGLNADFSIFEEGEVENYAYSVFFDEALWVVEAKEKLK